MPAPKSRPARSSTAPIAGSEQTIHQPAHAEDQRRQFNDVVELRIDRSHHRQDDRQLSTGSPRISSPESRDDWLQLQARDLITRLQHWSADLDTREARLNARIAESEVRERQLRLLQQESEVELGRRQAELDALAEQLRAQARRLAFQING